MQRRVEQRLREITVRHKTVVFNKFDSLVSEMGLLAAPAHQIGLLIDGAIIAAIVARNPKVADDVGAVMRVLMDSDKPAARKMAPPKLRARNPVHA